MGTVNAKSEENPRNHHEYEEKPQENHEINIENVKVRVDKVHVDGLGRTKDDIIEDYIWDLFRADNFQDVLLRAHRVRLKLNELDCFKNIGVFIDTSKGENASPDGLEVTFNVKEYKRLTGGVSTHVGNNEGSLSLGLKTPNLFGRGERVQLEYSHGSKKTTNFNVAFIKPLRGYYRPIFTASVFQAHSEWPSSGYKLLDRGILLDFGFNSTALFKHNLQWEGTIRDLNVLNRNTSFAVREQAGVTLKSAFKHILSIDTRDDLIFPNSGDFYKLSTEYSGLGGNVGYFKNEIYIQTNQSLAEDFVLQCTLNGGIMRGINNDMKISLADRFYVGGPTSVRGFQMRGIGQHSDGNSLGTYEYWAAGLHLFTPLPFRPGRGGFGDLFKTHLFMTAGNVMENGWGDGDLLQRLMSHMRVSYGIGIALRLGNMARLEVNYCWPYNYEKYDQIQPGVQFGIGVEFL